MMCYPFVFEFIAGLVRNQARADFYNFFQYLKIILPQCHTRFHNIHNHIGHFQHRRNLDRAVQFDDVNFPAFNGDGARRGRRQWIGAC